MRDQVQSGESLVEALRSDLSTRDERLSELEKRASSAEEQIDDSRKRSVDDATLSAELKIKITQRDREISEFQRKLDVMEYELKEANEQARTLEEHFSQGGADVEMMTTRVNQLREVIDETAKLIIDTAERTGAVVSGPIPLPTKIDKFLYHRDFLPFCFCLFNTCVLLIWIGSL